MIKKSIFVFCILILQSCASSKGYVGEKRPSSELATIHSSDIQKYGTVAKQFVMIEQINDVKVGDAMKGWPRKVETLPGEVKIIVKFGTMTFGKAIASGLMAGVGGAVGGAIAGSVNNSGMANNEIIATVEKGKSYKINFTSETHSIADLKVWLEPFIPKEKKEDK